MTSTISSALVASQPRSQTRAVQGTLKRVDYKRKELSLVAELDTWHFTLAPDCELCFNDEPAILRCFHPLDQVQVVYEEGPTGPVLTGMRSWD